MVQSDGFGFTGGQEMKLPGVEKVCPATRASLFRPSFYSMELLLFDCFILTRMVWPWMYEAGTMYRSSISCPYSEKTGVYNPFGHQWNHVLPSVVADGENPW